MVHATITLTDLFYKVTSQLQVNLCGLFIIMLLLKPLLLLNVAFSSMYFEAVKIMGVFMEQIGRL